MSLSDRIRRLPRPHDPERGAEVADALGLRGDARALVEGVAGSSPFLQMVLNRDGEWAANAMDREPGDVLSELVADAASAEDDRVESGLRAAKRRLSLLTALADLGGVWSLSEVTGALTDFAEAAVERALMAALSIERRRGRLPGEVEADGMVVIAMGKMGARELNYSSDIDLICLFDESAHPEDEFAERRTSLVRATRRMAALLSDMTGDGYVFRTDLRLRPDPSVTPVCLAMDAAERYYEALGRTWERAAWIKARPVAGHVDAGARFIETIRPFVWRKHLDFAAIRDAHDMRLRIRAHKSTHGEALERRNVKLGLGGIREIEFFTQTRQIIAGGRDPSLRVRGTMEALDRLTSAGWVESGDRDALKEDYVFLREIEHRLQMIGDAQTHSLPPDREGFARLADLCGRDLDELRSELTDRFARVARITEDFFAPQELEGQDLLGESEREVIAKWRNYPALRSPRSLEIFDRIAPALFGRVAKSTNPERTILHLDDFIGGLPAGVQVFSLFDSNTHLLDLVVDIADSAPELARYLGANSGVLDAVIGGDFFSPWPGRDGLRQDLVDRLEQAEDYERSLDAARRWLKEWHFRVGVHLLRGLTDPEEAGRCYADLAEATLTALWPQVVAEFAVKHGSPPGRGATVLGMGSLGARRLTAASDLDLIVVYDAEGDESSDGRRPMAARTYYARLTQALVTALSAPTAEGRLYQVDMRLRPSGRQGPIATALSAFRSYQQEEAWTWEHLALTRGRVVAGAGEVGDDVSGFLAELLDPPRDAEPILRDTADMRRRLLESRESPKRWEAKAGPGRLQDIELASSASALIGQGNPSDLQKRLESGGLFTDAERAAISEADRLFWAVQSAARLLAGEALSETTAAASLTRRVTGADDPKDLAARMDAAAALSAQAIERVMPSRSGEEPGGA